MYTKKSYIERKLFQKFNILLQASKFLLSLTLFFVGKTEKYQIHIYTIGWTTKGPEMESR
jgi:hypothetical protein